MIVDINVEYVAIPVRGVLLERTNQLFSTYTLIVARQWYAVNEWYRHDFLNFFDARA